MGEVGVGRRAAFGFRHLPAGAMVERVVGRNSIDRWTDEDDKRLLELQRAGKSNFWIAAALRRSRKSVVGRIFILKKRPANDANVTLLDRTKRAWHRADEQRITEMKTAGASVAEIAAAMNRTEAAVENRLHILKHRTPAT
jgi:hypothetical protein